MSEEIKKTVEEKMVEKYTLSQLKDMAKEVGLPVEACNAIASKLAMVQTILALKNAIASKPKDTPTRKSDDKVYRSKAEIMRQKLLSQPTTSIMIPLDIGGKEEVGRVDWVYNEQTKRKEQVIVYGAVHPVQINGYRYFVPKGVMVDVPVDVAKLIKDYFYDTQNAGKDIDINRVDDKRDGDPENKGKPVSNRL